jgi:hypothetical protein
LSRIFAAGDVVIHFLARSITVRIRKIERKHELPEFDAVAKVKKLLLRKR